MFSPGQPNQTLSMLEETRLEVVRLEATRLEVLRLEALRRYALLDTASEVAFERTVRLVARVFAVPIAMVTLMDLERQWFKACIGVDLTENTRALSFCNYTLLEDGVLVVPDAQLDPRFAENPVVSGLGIRFYAGAPLRTSDGFNIGTLCIYDYAPHPEGLTPDQCSTLEDLATSTMDDIEARRMVSRALEAEKRVRQLHQTQKQFVDDAAHELRAPLTAIRGNLEWMRNRPELLLEQRQEALADVLSEAYRLERLVQDMLTLARGESGPTLERVPVNLHTLLREVNAEAQHLTEVHTLELGAPELPLSQSSTLASGTLEDCWSLGHADQLKQVLLILVENALRYTPSGGRIALSLERQQNQAEIRVSDSGIGISSEDLTRVFERFYRASGSRERNPVGSGLGLAIAQGIVQAHGGKLWLESEPGQGTVAVLQLLLCSAPNTAA